MRIWEALCNPIVCDISHSHGNCKEVKGHFTLFSVQADVSTLLSALLTRRSGAARWLVSILIHFLYNGLPPSASPIILSKTPLHDLSLPFQPCGQYLWTALLHYWMGIAAVQSSQAAHRSTVCSLICWTADFRGTAARVLFLNSFQGLKLTSLSLGCVCYLVTRCLMLLTSGRKGNCTSRHSLTTIQGHY